MAAREGADKVLAYLLQTGMFQVDDRNLAKLTALHLTSSVSCAQILLEHKADIEAKDNDDETPFLTNASSNCIELLKYFVSNSRANVLATNKDVKFS